MNGADFHQYLVKLAMEAYDTSRPERRPLPADATKREISRHRAHNAMRYKFRKFITERMAQAAQLFVSEVEAASLPPLPTVEQESAMEAHEMSLRAKAATRCAICISVITNGGGFCALHGEPVAADVESLEGKHASDCALFTDPERGECDCRPDYTEDDGESMDGDHESALESVYGPDNDCDGDL